MLTMVLFLGIITTTFARTRYTFNTTCGTQISIESDANWDDAHLTTMMNYINDQECGELPGEVEIIR